MMGIVTSATVSEGVGERLTAATGDFWSLENRDGEVVKKVASDAVRLRTMYNNQLFASSERWLTVL